MLATGLVIGQDHPYTLRSANSLATELRALKHSTS
jgi:hypothetical protein